jgi:hypothetical protein
MSIAVIAMGVACAWFSLISEDLDQAPRVVWVLAVGFNVLASLSYVLGSQGEATLVAVGLMAISAFLGLLVPGRWWWGFATFTAIGLGSILATGWSWGSGLVDIFELIQGGANEVLHLRNPYALNMDWVPVYHHYPYLPAIPVIAAPFRALGDVRLASCLSAAICIATILVLGRRSGMTGWRWRGFVVFSLTLPLTVEMVQWSYADGFALGPLALYLALWRSRFWLAFASLVFALGTTVNVMVPMLPVFLWVRKMFWHAVLAAALVVLACTLLAYGVGFGNFGEWVLGFDHANILATLNINGVLWASVGGWLPAWVGVAIGGFAVGFVLVYKPKSIPDALAGAAAIKLMISLVAKYAQDNHYLIPAVMIWAAIAMGSARPDGFAPTRSIVSSFQGRVRSLLERREGARDLKRQ